MNFLKNSEIFSSVFSFPLANKLFICALGIKSFGGLSMPSGKSTGERIVNTPTGGSGECDVMRYFSLPSRIEKHDVSVVQNAIAELQRQW